MSKLIISTIDRDPSRLGTDATEADLEAYRDHLEAKLNEEFGVELDAEIQVRLASVWQSYATDSLVEARVRDIEATDEWLTLL